MKQHAKDQELGITPDREDATAEDPKTAYFSVLDLSKAFYTLPIHPESKWLTCFIVPQIGSFLWRGMPMGLASSPSNFVEATARRLRPWQILYEPGNEQPLEGKYNNPLTAEFCSPNEPTGDPKSSGDGCETHKDSISSLRKVTTFPSQTRNEGGSIKLDRRTQSSDFGENSVTGASAPTGSAAWTTGAAAAAEYDVSLYQKCVINVVGECLPSHPLRQKLPYKCSGPAMLSKKDSG